MLNRYIATIAFCILTTTSFSQHISPTDLLQLHRYWQMNDPRADKSVYDYLMTVDNGWRLRERPILNEKGFTAIYGYSRDHKEWYKPEECNLTVALDVGPPYVKAILYGFTDPDTWNEYKKQMQLMEATKLGTRSANGGQQTTYTINDIAFTLTEFPPGINGADRCYQVSIMRSK
ncbi:hypothetical protein [Mucilaginibacter sp. KACC 22063]|uniref:hypothetical protein n=1 Tax=Mucilaginibacter sp. KACC 22063 TaxID=3025666 RepID=UPI00236544EA|nr:hypothetical protein [Mucilaginibacter sp. KACC 22063]WDF54891.1 hypothetical protein PQ461_18335 [Mucilaginibacter sp. KACC 22063]